MKFPKPKKLTKNEYPDLLTPQPELFKELINEIIYPKEGSARERYLKETIDTLKENSKKKAKKLKLNQLFVNRKLYYINMCIQPGENVKGDTNINALVDTGAANSLIHMDIAKKFNLKYEKCRMTICTATGTDTESIKGIAHIKFRLKTTRNEIIETCANFIVTEKLNDLQCILGADFLMNSGKVTGVSPNSIIWKGQERTYRVKIADGEETHKLDRINKYIASYDYKRVIKQTDECTHCNKKLSNGPLDQHTIYTTDDQEKPIVISTDRDQAESIFKQNHIEIEDDRKSIDRIEIFSHSMKGEYENETLPESTEMFDDSQELKEEVLTKKISLEDGDYSECPPEHLGKLKALLI
jgi:hypothetical protein